MYMLMILDKCFPCLPFVDKSHQLHGNDNYFPSHLFTIPTFPSLSYTTISLNYQCQYRCHITLLPKWKIDQSMKDVVFLVLARQKR